MFDFLRTKESKYSLKTICRWLWQTSRGNRTQAVINVVLGVLGVLLSFAFIWATKLTIDVASGQTSPQAQNTIINLGGESLYQDLYSHATLKTAAILLIILLITQISLSIADRWVKALLGVRAQNRMQQKMFGRLLRNEWSGLEKHHSGDILNRLERDVSDVVNLLTEVLPSFLTVCFQLVGAFIFLYLMDNRLALFCVVALPVFLFISKVYLKKMRALTKDVRESDSKVQSLLQESVQHRMIIKTLEQTQTMVDKLEGLQSHLRAQVVTRTKLSTFSSTILSIGFTSVYLITFLWGAARLQNHTITYGTMMAFIQLVGQIQGPFRSLTAFIPSFISTFTASERLMELEEIPEEEGGKSVLLDGEVGVRFQHVTYAYNSYSRQVLADFTFDFPPGSSTAILGETGAGKTTLIRLMLSLIKPTQGDVTLYNADASKESTSLTRCNFVYVPQGNTLFSGTIRDNLLLGDPAATEADMHRALTEACAEFVYEMPDGLNTACGELGGGLSEGQAQRIVIARALLRKGGILLLDEATSALDMETEKRLIDNLMDNTHGKTLIFVTHRPAVVEHCTQVLHLEKLCRKRDVETDKSVDNGG